MERVKGISVYEKILLALTALFVVGCVVTSCLSVGGSSYTVTVTKQSNPLSWNAEEIRDDSVPDSLIPGEKINLNTAPMLELQRLPGIGEGRANAIVEYRQENGLFETIDELLLVDGVGETTLEKLREYVCIE